MVALYHGKFHDTSTHTSYLYFVKELSNHWLHFATSSAQQPRGWTLSDRRAGRFKEESPPGAGRAAHYTLTGTSVNAFWKLFSKFPKFFLWAVCVAEGSTKQEAHYRDCKGEVKRFLTIVQI